MRVNSFRKVGSPGADLSPNASRAVTLRCAAHWPVAVKPRQPAIAAETASRSRPGKGYRLPRAFLGSGTRAR
jgi:hypothetical protein